ncbi:hypothetical protein L873DRAFT_1823101, partial [Choiromyces venosus 120613-1]
MDCEPTNFAGDGLGEEKEKKKQRMFHTKRFIFIASSEFSRVFSIFFTSTLVQQTDKPGL